MNLLQNQSFWNRMLIGGIVGSALGALIVEDWKQKFQIVLIENRAKQANSSAYKFEFPYDEDEERFISAYKKAHGEKHN